MLYRVTVFSTVAMLSAKSVAMLYTFTVFSTVAIISAKSVAMLYTFTVFSPVAMLLDCGPTLLLCCIDSQSLVLLPSCYIVGHTLWSF